MDGRYGYRITISLWNQTQVLGYGVQKHGSLCQYLNKKVKDLWMHDYVWWMDWAHQIKYN